MLQLKVSVFSLPLLGWQQHASLRAKKYDVKHGRRRRKSSHDLREEESGLEDSGLETTDNESGYESSRSRAQSVVLTPEEARQYRAAGLSLDEEDLFEEDFPHLGLRDKTSERKRAKGYVEDLQKQWPPIFIPGSKTTESTLHVRHLGVLTTILHKCLLEGDFFRAGRAWGMLLHERFGRQPVDIRSGGRWGIGAEILFRQNSTPNGTGAVFTRPGFEAAKAYYERLVIQFPSRNARTEASSSLQFYPAMFSLWIYIVEQESAKAREALEYEEDDIVSENPSESGDHVMSDSENITDRSRDMLSRKAKIRQKELAGAQEIATRMDELMIGPPYSDSPALLQLRGGVSLWLGDLYVSSLARADEDVDMLDDDENVSSDRLIANRELHIALEKRASEGTKANELFEKAKMKREGADEPAEEDF
jgi:RNA polymerase I specific initiation factor